MRLTHRCLISLVTIFFLPYPLPAQSTDGLRSSEKNLQLIVEPSSTKTLILIEALRKIGEEYGLGIAIGSSPTQSHDARIIVGVGNGSGKAISCDSGWVTVSVCTASVLSPD